jgi:hypothetical protein
MVVASSRESLFSRWRSASGEGGWRSVAPGPPALRHRPAPVRCREQGCGLGLRQGLLRLAVGDAAAVVCRAGDVLAHVARRQGAHDLPGSSWTGGPRSGVSRAARWAAGRLCAWRRRARRRRALPRDRDSTETEPVPPAALQAAATGTSAVLCEEATASPRGAAAPSHRGGAARFTCPGCGIGGSPIQGLVLPAGFCAMEVVDRSRADARGGRSGGAGCGSPARAGRCRSRRRRPLRRGGAPGAEGQPAGSMAPRRSGRLAPFGRSMCTGSAGRPPGPERVSADMAHPLPSLAHQWRSPCPRSAV